MLFWTARSHYHSGCYSKGIFLKHPEWKWEHLSAIGVTDDFHCVTTRLLISPAPKLRWIRQVDRSKAKTVYKPNSYGTTSWPPASIVLELWLSQAYLSPQHYEPTPPARAGSDKNRQIKNINNATNRSKTKLGEDAARLNRHRYMRSRYPPKQASQA